MRNSRVTCGKAAATLFTLSAAALLAPANASAQTTSEPVQKPLSIKLGVFFPTSGHAENVGGDAQFSAGLDYAITKTLTRAPIIPSVYFDYEGGARNTGHTDVYGLGVAGRTYFNSPLTASVLPYAGVGVGVYDEDLKPSDQNSENKVTVGAKVFLGTEFTNNVFVEANYQFIPSASGINPSGPGVQVGYRF